MQAGGVREGTHKGDAVASVNSRVPIIRLSVTQLSASTRYNEKRSGVLSARRKGGSACERPTSNFANAPVPPCAVFNTVLLHAASLLTSSLSPGEYAIARRRDAARTLSAEGGGAFAGVETGMRTSNCERKPERACRAAFLPR